MGAATAVEKKAFVLFALLNALRERRCTPREVSIVDDVDSEVGGSGGESQQPTRRGIKFAVQTPTARCRPAPTPSACPHSFRPLNRAARPPPRLGPMPVYIVSFMYLLTCTDLRIVMPCTTVTLSEPHHRIGR